MAIYEADVKGDFDEVFLYLNETIIQASTTISIEESSYVEMGETKLAIRAYERFGALSSNRVSLQLTLIANKENLHVVVISTGASQGMIFKYNFFSEENFLKTVIPAIKKIQK